MPLPPLEQNGLLPPGVHDATMDEVEATFGRGSTRWGLMAKLREFVTELQQWRLTDELLIDGSFVTGEPNPHDIDLLLVFPIDYDEGRDVSPYEYNLRSHRMVKKRFGFDLFAVKPNTPRCLKLIDLFSQVKNRPGEIKGIVRLRP